jgi:phosphatidylserine/phosphatidylglycerophosphate/cardiolipin synthase-like enzyme
VLKVLFHPEIKKSILDSCNRATKSIYILAYTFDLLVLVWALVGAKRRGVAVVVILDRQQMTTGASKKQKEAVKHLLDGDVPVYTFKPQNGGGFTAAQHAKVIVADEAVAILGSANFSYNSMEWCTEANVTTSGREVIEGLLLQIGERRSAAMELTLPMLNALIKLEEEKRSGQKAASQKEVRIETQEGVAGPPRVPKEGASSRRSRSSGGSREGAASSGAVAGPAEGYPVAKTRTTSSQAEHLALYAAAKAKIAQEGADPSGSSSRSSRCIASRARKTR